MKMMATKSLMFSVDDNEDLCLTCHEREKPNNQLVYFSSVMKDKFFTSSYYGNQDQSKTLFSSCMHTIHTKCFIKFIKQNRYQYASRCPLCSAPVNCVLPYRYDKNSEANSICENSIIISLGVFSNNFMSEGFFMMLFKHLVESKGLNSLIFPQKYMKEKFLWRKLNKHVELLLSEIYSKASELERVQYEEHVSGFMESIKECSNDNIRMLQLLLGETFWSKIQGRTEVDMDVLAAIKKNLVKEEF